MIDKVYYFYLFRFTLIIIEMFSFILLFLWRSEKRKFWWLGTSLTLLITIGLIALGTMPLNVLFKKYEFNPNIVSPITGAAHILILGFMIIGFARSFKVPIYELFSNIFLGYSLRQIAFCIYSVILNSINPNLLLIRFEQQNVLNFVIYLAIYGGFFILSTCLINTLLKNRRFTLELPIFVVLTVVIIFNTLVMTFAEVISDEHLTSYTFLLLSQIIVLVLIIVINFYTQKHIELKLSKDLSETLLKKQEEQYKFAKANAELLYVKAHDLKHQVAILRKGGEDAEKILSDLESVISNYDSVVLTDNSVMNVILSEKWQYCSKHNIKLSYTVDPKAFSHMDNIHLYTLLGNILDNAIEAVMKIKDKNKRLISLTISNNKGISMLKTYNYFSGTIKLQDGVLQTNKKDKQNHGFGIKSINMITAIYQGDVSFSVENDIFNLQVTVLDK